MYVYVCVHMCVCICASVCMCVQVFVQCLWVQYVLCMSVFCVYAHSVLVGIGSAFFGLHSIDNCFI